MSTSELKRLKELEAELAQFKRIVANLSLQNMVMKEVVKKKL
jgi:putative transposase